jgi:hypothetical protein
MDDSIPKELVYKFLNSPQYRTVHVDGVFGGVTTRGLISLSLYSEHSSLPSKITYQINEDRIPQEFSRENFPADVNITREIEINAMFDLEVAKSTRDWLDGHIKTLENLKNEGKS